jgi:ABC-type multidrug transport system fused ATPase/permease subunit
MSLFRIAELSNGRILIDGVNISTLSLTSLRSSIEICPQCPVIFKGTLRNYLDPFEEFADEDIIKSLIKSQFSDIMCKVVEIEEEKVRSRNDSVVKSRTSSVDSITNNSDSIGLDYPVSPNKGDNSSPQKFKRTIRNDNINDPIFKKMINFTLEENGNNLSVGERQMLVLSRVLLRGAKIFIMDEGIFLIF